MSIANNEEKELQDEDAIICICDSDIDDNATIQCDGCGRWQHMRCVGIDPAVVDLDDLVYHCDQCEPRILDVVAAKSYIERYKREEAQSVQPKARRGRGKGAGRRANAQGSSPGSRLESRRHKSQKSVDSDETDEVNDPGNSNSGLRDYTLLDEFLTTDDAAAWKSKHLQDQPLCPSTIDIQGFSTVSKLVPNTNGQVRGLFSERDAPSSAFVGRFLGIVDTRANYERDALNAFDSLRGPVTHVAFVQQCELIIDARKFGNDARYIRKSCSPNCTLIPMVLEPATPEGLPSWQFLLALNENIRKGEELTIGFQWPTEHPPDFVEYRDTNDLYDFASGVITAIGECACKHEPRECNLQRWVMKSSEAPSRKRSPSNDQISSADSIMAPVVETKSAIANGVVDTPMTREERKIQMAIARMENADAPKTKRRRRNTGDESTRPVHSRRASSLKVEDAGIAEDTRLSASPPPSIPKETRGPRAVIKSRARLIRSSSPEYTISEIVPRKLLWLRSFSSEKVIKEEQRLKLAEQAKEATARLAEEASKKRLELEAQAREAKELKDREAEAERRKAEKQAKESLQRAREREIWGDHPSSVPVLSQSVQDPIMADGYFAKQTIPGQTPQTNSVSRVESPTSMGPPSLPRDHSRSSPQEMVVPKIVRKLSVSEYIRQKKEKEAASEASPSPRHDGIRNPRETSLELDSSIIEEKSDGEIEAGELDQAKTESYNHQPIPSAPIIQRGDFLQTPPTAPKSVTQYHHQPFHNATNISRNYPAAQSQQSNHSNHFPAYNRHGYSSEQRQSRSANGYTPPGSNPQSLGNNPGTNNNNRNNMIPTGPKFPRTNSVPDTLNNNNSKPYPSA